jgi:hypothetical protein
MGEYEQQILQQKTVLSLQYIWRALRVNSWLHFEKYLNKKICN